MDCGPRNDSIAVIDRTTAVAIPFAGEVEFTSSSFILINFSFSSALKNAVPTTIEQIFL